MQQTKFRTKDGQLTVYALACGYVQTKCTREGYDVSLWHEGGPCYHVQAIDNSTPRKRLFWFSTWSLKEARRVYKTVQQPKGDL